MIDNQDTHLGLNGSYNDLFYDLFAFRLQYMDYSINENYIIRKLKIKLIELGYPEVELNNIIYLFYNYFDIPITLSEIENISITNNSSMFYINSIIIPPINNQQSVQSLNDNQDNNDEQTDQNNNLINILNILLGTPINIQNMQFEQILINPIDIGHPLEDVVVTTNNDDLNKLDILKITTEMNERCTICLEDMKEDEEYFNIECKHIFHKNCLETYLKNYNHICPLCREDIGESEPHLSID